MIVSATFSGICDLKLMRGVWGLFITFITGSFPYYHAILDILYLLHKASQTLMLSVHTRSITLLFLSSTKITGKMSPYEAESLHVNERTTFGTAQMKSNK